MLRRYFIGSLSVHLTYEGKRGSWAHVYTMRLVIFSGVVLSRKVTLQIKMRRLKCFALRSGYRETRQRHAELFQIWSQTKMPDFHRTYRAHSLKIDSSHFLDTYLGTASSCRDLDEYFPWQALTDILEPARDGETGYAATTQPSCQFVPGAGPPAAQRTFPP